MITRDLLRSAGVIGAGGAGFPSYMKLTGRADVLLVNGSECEPLLYTDRLLLRDRMDEILEGIAEIRAATDVKSVLLCIKRHTLAPLGLSDGEPLAEGVHVKALPDVYPIGDEISLIYEATGRLVRPGALPFSVGVIVYNVETVLNIAAAASGRPVTDSYLSVGGAVREPIVVRTPVGTPVHELLRQLDVEVPSGHVLIDGGPSMGQLVTPSRAVVRKNTKALLVLPEDAPAVRSKTTGLDVQRRRCASNCCQCTRCTDLCPRALLGYPLEPHRMVRTEAGIAALTPELVKTASLCCGCGICELFACCQGISPRAMIAEYKRLLSREGVRFTADQTPTPHPERAFRMLSSDKWSEMLGVRHLDRAAERLVSISPTRVRIPLDGHIGAPSVPTVKVGDHVLRGELIAEAKDGALSVANHASIDGTVSAVTPTTITIERD